MFGFVIANREMLSEHELERYKACYCGLCRTIRARSGVAAGLTLNYDLTFLVLLFTALYAPDEQNGKEHCVIHPVKSHEYWVNCYTNYAADMNVLLAYYKLMDDWHDEKDILRRGYAQALKGNINRISTEYPRQSHAITDCLENITQIERDNSPLPDAAAHWFGVLMGELFYLKEDEYAATLRKMAYFLGKFIYLQDASIDLHKDLKKERYNPLAFISQTDHRTLLSTLIGSASDELEKLPLGSDAELLRNIVYSGVWTRYEAYRQQMDKRKEGTNR